MSTAAAASAETPARESRDGNAVDILISLTASAASAVLAGTASGAWHAISAAPIAFVSFLGLSIALQLLAVNVYGRGSISVSGIGLLAVGMTFGVGAAMATAILLATIQAVRNRSRAHRAVFNAATFSLAVAAGTSVYHLAHGSGLPPIARLVAAFGAGVVSWGVNIGLLSLAMALAEGSRFLNVWRERWRWVTVYYLSFGPLALASILAYESIGLTGLLAFAVPPALVFVSVQQYLGKTREAVEDVRRANEELKEAIAELAARNDDLRDLFDFAGGLAAQTHDRNALLRYAQETLARVTDGQAHVILGEFSDSTAVALAVGGKRIGSIRISGDNARWERLRDAIVPQLATALESAMLVDQVRKTHVQTIAALSRSMEAKDYYTGGHTERVSSIAVALATRLGYTGADVDAIEIGALLHDIGKIGIPEQILRKPGPLDEEEWKVMKEHPVISAYILSEIDLPPAVLEIARHSHERMDGGGYPDRLAGEAIPLAARIVLVADAFDALTSDRSYRRARTAAVALAEIRANVGTQFCPCVFAALEQVFREEAHVLTGEHLLARVA